MKKARLALFSIFAAIIFTLVFGTATFAAPKLSKTSITIVEGKTQKLKIKNKGKKKVIWKSSNKKIATVTKNGVVKAKKEGTCKIIAKVNKKKLVCKVTVTGTKNQRNIGISSSASSGINLGINGGSSWGHSESHSSGSVNRGYSSGTSSSGVGINGSSWGHSESSSSGSVNRGYSSGTSSSSSWGINGGSSSRTTSSSISGKQSTPFGK